MASKLCVTKAMALTELEKFEKTSPLVVKLSPPWYGWQHEVKSIFENDPEISVAELEVTECRGGYVLTIDTTNPEKGNALKVMLPLVKNFGNINVEINVTVNGTPVDFIGGRDSIPETIGWINKLFAGSGDHVEGQCYEMFGGYVGFVVCPARIVQFYNDDITDVNGNTTMLFADAARDVIDIPAGISFCTEPIRK